MNISELRERWLSEKDQYKEFANHVHELIKAACNQEGINPKISFREKDLASFIKKAIRKSYKDPYTRTVDKAGVRVVTNFPFELTVVSNLIKQNFKIHEIDNKSERLALDKIGYKSIHFTVSLLDPEKSHFRNKKCEIQVRTLCQDLWSEMSHILAYKSDIKLPNDIKRRIICLGALLEVAENDFADIESRLKELPEFYELKLLDLLEQQYYQFVGATFSKDLSRQVLRNLKLCLPEIEQQAYKYRLGEFCKDHGSVIKAIIAEYSDTNPFSSQPELLFILERLESDRFSLRRAWESHYPFEYLEDLAIAFGEPY